MSALPTKYVPIDYSLIGIGSMLLEELRPGETVSSLWEKMAGDHKIRTFDRFADGLSLLFAAGVVDLRRGVIVRVKG